LPDNYATFSRNKHLTNCYKSVFERAYDEVVIILFGESVLSLNTKELNEKLKAGKRHMVIDILQPEEYCEVHSVGAKFLPRLR